MDWFLYDVGLSHKRVKLTIRITARVGIKSEWEGS